ncbi:MAG TPA: membrane protein insertion efficiency factor YidD [Solirubrobacterales bacterium]|nr:membrane protein insertion efficiency factor YidD [Solirubrobacterales bacterium]
MKRSLAVLRRASRRVADALAFTLLLPLRIYSRLISPALPARCKYYPTCSAYAEQAVRELGIVRGVILAAWRLARCNPWSHGGVDELSDRRLFQETPLRSARDDHHGAAA